MVPAWLTRFVTESNRIEGVRRDPTSAEVDAHRRFLEADLSMAALVEFVSVVQPDARLRDELGLDVRVGNHLPPPGGSNIRDTLESLLIDANEGNDDAHPYLIHQRYETLHPFTDGNGRSGRVLWLWGIPWIGELPRVQQLGFLHCWYYQSLEFSHVRKLAPSG